MARVVAPRTARGPAPEVGFERASSFVGREGDLLALAARFDEGARLVSIVAPGGMGKTRLATRFATEAREAFAAHGGGVFIVDLSQVTGAAGFVRAIAAALEVPLERARDPEVVARALGRAIARRKRMLIVLDNFETVLRDASPLLRIFSELAPDTRWLVTSRVVLGLAGEHLLPLEPLAVPAIDDDPGEALTSPAVTLFLKRAREVRPDFAVDDAEVATLVQLVRRTDGIPLGVELAAARISVLSLAQISARLSSPLDLLVAGHAEGRHASMRQAILDSLGPLDPPERKVLARASVFRGGFTLEAAEAIVVDDPAAALDLVASLTRASLLRVVEIGGERRFSLFEVIRELVGAELASDPADLDRTRARHAAYFAVRGRELADAALAAPGSDALVRLGRDLDNLVAGHAHAIGRAGLGDAAAASQALELAVDAGLVSMPRGAIALHLDLLDRALAVSADVAAPPLVARAVLGRGIARRELGDIDGARHDLEDVLRRGRDLDDPTLEAQAIQRLGEIVETLGRTAEARARFEEALACLARATPGRARRRFEAEARSRLGHALRREGALVLAAREIDEALRIRRADDDPTDEAGLRYEAGVIALIAERHEEAFAHFEKALAAARRTGERQAEAAIESGRAILLQETGRLDEALAVHADAVRIFQEIGSLHREASARYYLGAAFLERGATAEAIRVLGRAFERMAAIGMRRYEVLIAGALAVAEAIEGRAEAADAWLAIAGRAVPDCASEPPIEGGLAIRRLHVAIALGRRADREAALAEARAIRGRGDNDDVRFAIRLLERSGRHVAPGRTLRIARDAATFTFLGGPVDLGRRAPLRRILLALAGLHAAASGEPLSLDDAVRAGWPGERMGAAAAANRVRVALATLRKLGLKQAIVTAQGGYRLDAALAVVVEAT